MGELKYRAETIANGISEAAKTIDSQAGRIDNMLRELKSMAEYAERIEAENIQLKKQLDDQAKQYERKLTEATKQK
jgi:hypothetical protein